VIRYAKPGRLDDALALLGQARWKILAGGTDFYPAQGNRPLCENVLDINGLGELAGISQTPSHVVIGARTTWSEIVRHPLPPAFDALKQAAREVGSVQIQNTGTVAGNLCNASPAADGVPGLLVLDAEVGLASLRGTRWLPLADFILGNRRTARAADELLTAIRVPNLSLGGASHFLKLGARRYLVISIAMVATRLDIDRAGTIRSAAVAVGACSAVAQRLTALEAALRGAPADVSAARLVGREHLAGLSPIDDVRGSAGYRLEAAREIVARSLLSVLGDRVRRGEAA